MSVNNNVLPTKVFLKSPPVRRFLIFVVMVLSWAQIWVGMQTVATYGDVIIDDLGISNLGLATSDIMTVFVGIGCLLSGVIGAKIGAKKTVLIGCLISALSGLMWFMHPTNVPELVLIRVVEGFGSGLINGYTVSLIGAWFPRRERAFALGLQMGLYGVAVSSTSLFCAAFDNAGFIWSQAIGTFIIAATLICFLLDAVVLKDIEKEYGVYTIDEVLESENTANITDAENSNITINTNNADFHKPATYLEALKSPLLWIVAGGISILTSAQYNLQYCYPFLFRGWNYTPDEVTALLAIVFTGTLIAAPLGGLLSDRVFKGSRWQVMAICFVTTFVMVLVFFAAGNAHVSYLTILVIGFVLYFCSDIAVGVMYAITPEVFDPSFFAKANGIVMLSCNFIGLATVLVSGWLADVTGGYLAGLGMTALLSIVGLVCALSLKTFSKRHQIRD